MLAPKNFPVKYLDWNKNEFAPYGKDRRGARYISKYFPKKLALQLLGKYSVQPNNDTRRFEYPWAFYSADLKPQMKVLDLGGGLAGFQFSLSQFGLDVTNVDPGLGAKGKGWKCDHENIELLNKAFDTNVTLVNKTLPQAQLAENSFDRVFSISVIEHFSEEDFEETINYIYKVLKVGGLFILTTDLFIDCAPFTTQENNEWGKNYPIANLLNNPNYELVIGKEDELYGSANFDTDTILKNISKYLLGGFYPTLTQCMVLRKTA